MLRISFSESARYPVQRLRLAGGENEEVSILGAAFLPIDGGRWSDTLRLPAAAAWPLKIAVVSPAEDTLGSATGIIQLEAGQLTTVWLAIRANLGGTLEPCAPLLLRIPVTVPNAASDTLYLTSWGPAPLGAQFPIC